VKQIVANINVDMIGRNAPDTTVAIGQDLSSLGPTVQAIVKAHPELKLTVAPDLWPEENLFVRSDHFNFARAEIPAIFFTSGLHGDYHKPSDEPETIDNDKLARTAQLLFYLGLDVANAAAAPAWTEAGLKVIRGQ
jgi:Zn-dependent M28 family amino/carboxypeptidase